MRPGTYDDATEGDLYRSKALEHVYRPSEALFGHLCERPAVRDIESLFGTTSEKNVTIRNWFLSLFNGPMSPFLGELYLRYVEDIRSQGGIPVEVNFFVSAFEKMIDDSEDWGTGLETPFSYVDNPRWKAVSRTPELLTLHHNSYVDFVVFMDPVIQKIRLALVTREGHYVSFAHWCEGVHSIQLPYATSDGIDIQHYNLTSKYYLSQIGAQMVKFMDPDRVMCNAKASFYQDVLEAVVDYEYSYGRGAYRYMMGAAHIRHKGAISRMLRRRKIEETSKYKVYEPLED